MWWERGPLSAEECMQRTEMWDNHDAGDDDDDDKRH